MEFGIKPQDLVWYQERGEHFLKDIETIFGPDPYGIRSNAKAFDLAQTFSVEQGLTDRKQPLEEIFPREILYMEERLS